MHTSGLYKTISLLAILVVGFLGYQVFATTRLKADCKATLAEEAILIGVFLDKNTSPSSINKLRTNLVEMNRFKTVTAVSSEEALADFKERHSDDPLTLQALDTLGTNPLSPKLTLQTKDWNLDDLDKQIQTAATNLNISIDTLNIDESSKIQFFFIEENTSPLLGITSYFSLHDRELLKYLKECAQN